MINHLKQSQLVLNQEQLNYRHSQILANHKELETKYFQQEINQQHTFSQPLQIKQSDYNLEEKRLLVISRLQSANLCKAKGYNPWQLISNRSYDNCKNPCITVVITLYNYSKYIYECLDSVSQSDISDLPGNIEVLVIDDCSSDNSAILVEEYLEKADKSNLPICLIKKWFNTGLADARNVGLELARSPYVFILDADNWIYPHCLSILYNKIKYSKYAAVYGEISRFDNDTRTELNRISCHEWDVNKLVKQPYIDAMALFDKDILLKVGGYSTDLIEYGWFGWDDYDVWLKLAQSNYSCKFIPKVLSAYRVHSTSMINTTNKYALNLAKHFCHKFADIASKHQTSDLIFGFPQSELYQSHIPEDNPQILLQELQFAHSQIAAMKSSKLWKLKTLLKLLPFQNKISYYLPLFILCVLCVSAVFFNYFIG
ncbi:glycosyltransferase family 2 protein [Rivularia sp. UHCC 0363]|uniref:glycosyltransferase family 2 protein n=1 Tax=Rivularia sp. UHCC 0363 TaxID=3110244 RepID=UPI002B20FC97|nr:glycosyltransferase family 2 protein [Rivularia sp. UHCC 0363]MEA5594381.1 glycosyltransferase family 2 protein [Rivularia sp. UHCC 0363]